MRVLPNRWLSAAWQAAGHPEAGGSGYSQYWLHFSLCRCLVLQSSEVGTFISHDCRCNMRFSRLLLKLDSKRYSPGSCFKGPVPPWLAVTILRVMEPLGGRVWLGQVALWRVYLPLVLSSSAFRPVTMWRSTTGHYDVKIMRHSIQCLHLSKARADDSRQWYDS